MATKSEPDPGPEPITLVHLPAAVLATILTKLDVASLCSAVSTCKSLRDCYTNALSFLPTVHLLDVSPTRNLLRQLLPPTNPFLQSLKVNCRRLDDSALDYILRSPLQELSLHNCAEFSGSLLSRVGQQCKHLRSLYLSSLAERRGRSIDVSHLEELLSGCTELEALTLMFDVSVFLRRNFARVWALASPKLVSLEIGYMSAVMVSELLSPVVGPEQPSPTILPNLQKLCISVDYITDTMVTMISRNLTSLIHLDLRDSPIVEPSIAFDLTNSGLQQINSHGNLKYLSLVRSQEFIPTCFKRVNDLGILLMADNCSNMESIRLGGFSRVTDTGFKTILHSCTRLYKLRVSHGNHLTDLVFHDIAATSLCLTHVSLRWCNLLTNHAIARLVVNKDLNFLDLRDCRILGDESLKAINTLPELKTLLLDGCDISDTGISHLRKGVMNSLVSLSVRGCKRLTDHCISCLFGGDSNKKLRELDLSNLPNLTDAGVLALAKSRVPLSEVRIRQCPMIGDTSVMALASMQVGTKGWKGSSLRLLDVYNCGGITQVTFKWLKKPYFPKLRWVGVPANSNSNLVDGLINNRPYLHVCSRGEELGTDQWDNLDDLYIHDYEQVDEFEQWLLDGDDDEDDDDYEEMEEDEDADDDESEDDEDIDIDMD